jgi:hypothetical protein
VSLARSGSNLLRIAGGGGVISVGAESSDPYDLGTVPFAYDWPTAPTTSTTIEVDTIAEFQSAVGQSGAIINVAAGTYTGNLTVDGSDLDIRVSNSAFITGVLTWAGDRIKWTGGNLVDGNMEGGGFTDILVDDFYVDSDGDTYGTPHNFADSGAWSRMAWINSTIAVYGGDTSGSWAWFANQNGGSDLIMANVKMISTDGQNNRFMNCDNLILVDCVFNPTNESANGLRCHNICTNVFISDCTVVNIIKFDQAGSEVTASVEDATLDGLINYNPSLNIILHGSQPNTGSMANTAFHHSTGGSPASPTPLSDGGGNTWVSWDHSTLPDFSAYGAQR